MTTSTDILHRLEADGILTILDPPAPAETVETLVIERRVRSYEFAGVTVDFYVDPLSADHSIITVRVMGVAVLADGTEAHLCDSGHLDYLSNRSMHRSAGMALRGASDSLSAWHHATAAAGAVMSSVTTDRYGLPARFPTMKDWS